MLGSSLFQEQYTFCHDAILEAVQCGNTQIYAHDLRIALARMDDVTKENKVSRFEAEFKVRKLDLARNGHRPVRVSLVIHSLQSKKQSHHLGIQLSLIMYSLRVGLG